MFDAISRWRQRRVLERAALPDALWNEAIRRLPFVAIYDDEAIGRLREKVVLFLDAKGVVGARGHEVTPLQRVIIAIQACVLVLELDLALYDSFENVIVYPGEFIPDWEWEDEAGVVHRNIGALAGEAMPGGPVVLSWPDVEASADWESSGMNLVIHEFAHKIDMQRGEATGAPPLPASMSVAAWQKVFTAAYEDFCGRIDGGEETAIDPYAAESPAEFFAVASEVFFAEPLLLDDEYPDVYAQLTAFYRQDPGRNAER
ncbi:MAG TPA: M90 family metallopeptidase [Casimicrobiaceae bacterium]|nr:M90 family metallopeptidase [Casimicrobiaceae bacterium]